MWPRARCGVGYLWLLQRGGAAAARGPVWALSLLAPCPGFGELPLECVSCLLGHWVLTPSDPKICPQMGAVGHPVGDPNLVVGPTSGWPTLGWGEEAAGPLAACVGGAAILPENSSLQPQHLLLQLPTGSSPLLPKPSLAKLGCGLGGLPGVSALAVGLGSPPLLPAELKDLGWGLLLSPCSYSRAGLSSPSSTLSPGTGKRQPVGHRNIPSARGVQPGGASLPVQRVPSVS